MSEQEKNKNNPLHGVTLQHILETLVECYGFKELGAQVDIRCFLINPTISSCLKFLRKTPWARAKVEELYIKSMGK
ncbi:MAG TPA: VF530 family protein [Sulfurimonas sp.]|uniref:VF530 family protein n=1 Tax=Sulfurimonas sp. TaxID=2022749 RepID=UPI002C32C11C|nr:VF530 family protein [Sulfurimonas sp.]HUH43069.1 VF530 family protein [Sulfurimonas sp.]